jgi:hypothetical protein
MPDDLALTMLRSVAGMSLRRIQSLCSSFDQFQFECLTDSLNQSRLSHGRDSEANAGLSARLLGLATTLPVREIVLDVIISHNC